MTRTRLGLISTLIGIVALAACAPPNMWFKPVRFQVVQPVASSGVKAGMAATDLREKLEGSPAKAVLLPFADYSSYDTPRLHVRSHALLEKCLIKKLERAGMEKGVAAGQHVASFLFQQGAILDAASALKEESPQTVLLLRELEGEWSDPMIERIGQVIHQNMIEVRSLAGSADSRPLDNDTICKIAEAFSARYVVRGRITAYQSALKLDTYPFPEEGLAFYFPGENVKVPRVGIASLDAYEQFGQDPLPASTASIRSEENRPSEEMAQRVTPYLRLDLFMQDAGTGEVVYSGSSLVSLAELGSVSVEGYSKSSDVLETAIRRAADHILAPLM